MVNHLRALYDFPNILGDEVTEWFFDDEIIDQAIAKPLFVVIPSNGDKNEIIEMRNHMQYRSPILVTGIPHWDYIKSDKWEDFRNRYKMQIVYNKPHWHMPDLSFHRYGVFGAAVVNKSPGDFYCLHIWGFNLEWGAGGDANPDMVKYVAAETDVAKTDQVYTVIQANADILYISLMRMITMSGCKHYHVHLTGVGLGAYLRHAQEHLKGDIIETYYERMLNAISYVAQDLQVTVYVSVPLLSPTPRTDIHTYSFDDTAIRDGRESIADTSDLRCGTARDFLLRQNKIADKNMATLSINAWDDRSFIGNGLKFDATLDGITVGHPEGVSPQAFSVVDNTSYFHNIAVVDPSTRILSLSGIPGMIQKFVDNWAVDLPSIYKNKHILGEITEWVIDQSKHYKSGADDLIWLVVPGLDPEDFEGVIEHMMHRVPMYMGGPTFHHIKESEYKKFQTDYRRFHGYGTKEFDMPNLGCERYGVLGEAFVKIPEGDPYRIKGSKLYWLHIWAFNLEWRHPTNPDYARWNEALNKNAPGEALDLARRVYLKNAQIVALSLLKIAEKDCTETNICNLHVHLVGIGMGYYIKHAGQAAADELREYFYQITKMAKQCVVDRIRIPIFVSVPCYNGPENKSFTRVWKLETDLPPSKQPDLSHADPRWGPARQAIFSSDDSLKNLTTLTLNAWDDRSFIGNGHRYDDTADGWTTSRSTQHRNAVEFTHMDNASFWHNLAVLYPMHMAMLHLSYTQQQTDKLYKFLSLTQNTVGKDHSTTKLSLDDVRTIVDTGNPNPMDLDLDANQIGVSEGPEILSPSSSSQSEEQSTTILSLDDVKKEEAQEQLWGVKPYNNSASMQLDGIQANQIGGSIPEEKSGSFRLQQGERGVQRTDVSTERMIEDEPTSHSQPYKVDELSVIRSLNAMDGDTKPTPARLQPYEVDSEPEAASLTLNAVKVDLMQEDIHKTNCLKILAIQSCGTESYFLDSLAWIVFIKWFYQSNIQEMTVEWKSMSSAMSSLQNGECATYIGVLVHVSCLMVHTEQVLSQLGILLNPDCTPCLIIIYGVTTANQKQTLIHVLGKYDLQWSCEGPAKDTIVVYCKMETRTTIDYNDPLLSSGLNLSAHVPDVTRGMKERVDEFLDTMGNLHPDSDTDSQELLYCLEATRLFLTLKDKDSDFDEADDILLKPHHVLALLTRAVMMAIGSNCQNMHHYRTIISDDLSQQSHSMSSMRQLRILGIREKTYQDFEPI